MAASQDIGTHTPVRGKRNMLAALATFAERRTLVMLALGFSAGLPFLLVFDTLSAWLRDKAIMRMHRTLGCRPFDRLGADTAAMLSLPPVKPRLGWQASTRLPRDHYVRIGSNDYSVDPIAIGRRIDIHADLTTVTVRCGDRLVGAHDRHWGRHQTIQDPVHLQAAAQMRLRPARITGPTDDDVQIRALADYDGLLGTDEVVA
jgi:hypothetical protein